MNDSFDLADTLVAAAGALLSLAFSYLPGLQAWYEAQDATRKRLVMLACLALVAAAAGGLDCLPSAPAGLKTGACQASGAWQLGRAFVLAAMANQAAFLLAPRPAAQPDSPAVRS